MGEQSATRLKGDRYQHLYSWYEILRLLDDDCPYAEAVVEHPTAGAADDVTLHPKAGSDVPTRFVQVKFHVDYRDHYSFESLVRGTGVTDPVLPGLFAAWRRLAGAGPVEVSLVSNWAAAPHPDIGRVLGHGYRLVEEFFTCSAKSKVGLKRKLWQHELGATEAEVQAFCRALTLKLTYGDLSTLDEQLDDRMGRHGLKMGANARAIVADEISLRIQAGGERKRITRPDVLEIIERRDLRRAHPDEPEARLWVHGWAKQGFDRRPTVELDWTSRFDRDERRVPSPDEWGSELLPQLREARAALAALPAGKYVDYRGKVPLTAALAVGATLSEVAGFKLRLEQPTGGESLLWRSDAAPSGVTLECRHEEGAAGDDVLVGISISGDGLSDLKALYARGDFAAMLYLEPRDGTGNAAIKSAGDAAALANSARELLRGVRARYAAKRLHLVLYTPAAFAVFLGQRLNALGTVVTYERTVEGGYQESVSLPTG